MKSKISAELLAKIRASKEAKSIPTVPIEEKLPTSPTSPSKGIDFKTRLQAILDRKAKEKASSFEAAKVTEVTEVTKSSPKEHPLLAKIRAKKAEAEAASKAILAPTVPNSSDSSDSKHPETKASATGMHGETITYNKEQQEFIDLVVSRQSCVLIGAAGTGKTTCSQGAINALIASNGIPLIKNDGHRHLVDGTAGILIIAFTRRAVNNSRKVQSADFKNNCITAHKLLEYGPKYFEIEDSETDEIKKTMQFTAARNSANPLPEGITTIIVEEASMLGVDLFMEIEAACPTKVQWIFIGDIQQLPPVFGPAILGFKLLELPVVELTQVYRQALESPIIRLAHRILQGKPLPPEDFSSPEWKVENKLTIHPWKKKLNTDNAMNTLAAFFKAALAKGAYNPEEDMILIPYNKACGTLELNAHLANYLAKQRGAVTYEVMAGFNKHYFSAGDKVLYDKEDAEIVHISKNKAYAGARVQRESPNLDYWGHNPKARAEANARKAAHLPEDDGLDVDLLLETMAGATEDRVTQASHEIIVRLNDTMQDISISKASDINNLLHAYALTVHKAQGSEWRKVFVCLHQSHAAMLQRELLYTAVTRAREELYIICEPESMTKGINSQRIKGNTLQEKAEFFKGKELGSKSTKKESEKTL